MPRLHSKTHELEALEAALDKLLQQSKSHPSRGQKAPEAARIQIKPLPYRQRILNAARRRVAAWPWLKRPAGIIWAFLKGWEFRIDSVERIEHLEQALQRQQQAQQAEVDRLAAACRHENLRLRLELNRLQKQLREIEQTKAKES